MLKEQPLSSGISNELEHRGGLADRLSRLRPEPDLIERIGGRHVLERVVDRLYEGIAEDPLLQPLFGGRAHGEHLGQKQFFEEWAGGEPRYRQAGTGSGMYLLHYRFGIDRKSAGRWLHHLVKAMRAEGLQKSVIRDISRILGPMAHALSHNDGPPLPPELRRLSTSELQDELARAPDLFLSYRGEARRLLFRAAETGDVERIRILAAAGVSLDAPMLRDGLMLTPWCVACQKGQDEAASALLDLGARVDIFSGAFLGDLSLLESLLDRKPDLVNVEDPAMDMRGIQPLHHAIVGRRPDAALLLLRRGAKPGPDSAELLRKSADAGWTDLVRGLLQTGADAENVGPGPWVLHSEISDLLLADGADVNRPEGDWLRFCTARFGQQDHPALIRRFLELGADTEARDREAGPLHLAASAGHLGVLEELLAAGLSVDTLDGAGETPLAHVSWAVRTADRVASARLLLDRGANIDHCGPQGVTVRERLQRARSQGRDQLLALLALYGNESKRSSQPE